MEITFSLADIESLKRELTRLLPDVKSSHRVEAMARGLGWNTNAALRADLSANAIGRVPDPKAFETYLRDYGFAGAPSVTLLHVIARTKFPSEYAAIQRVMDRDPDLATGGYGLPGDRSQPRAQREAEFRQDREEMLTPERIGQFIRARAYLEPFGKRQSLNTKVSSYGLKHRAENFHRERGVNYSYVSNGMLIAAALDLGFRVKPTNINAFLNISSNPGSSESTAKGERPFVPVPRGARKKAWGNVMITAINAGLEQNLFGLKAGDNRWTGTRAKYHFTVGDGLPAIASVADGGFGELIINVLVNPRGEAEGSIGVMAWSGFWAKVSDAFASGWLERAKGRWLQTDGKPMCYFRRDIITTLAGVSVRPKGYTSTGRFMM
jgi:hypothetical protein